MDQHLERERHEGKIDFLQPHADRADDQRAATAVIRRSRATKATGIENWSAASISAEAVGAEAEEHAVAERDHAGVADQQIERGREQPVGRAAE